MCYGDGMSQPSLILLGDDDVEMLEIVADALERKGFEVITAKTGPDLYIAAKNDSPDLILSDYDYGLLGRSDDFPNGVAIGLRLRSEGVDTPFVIWSGLERRDALEAGFPSWIKSDIPELPGMVEAVLSGE